jgi:PhzF family phenazine biosynthesis protein
VDAFTREPFKGNPAAVCILHDTLQDQTMQAIAAEMNLSETAFLQPLENKPIKDTNKFSLRWFTPTVEVPLCGHATLAASAVLFHDINVLTDELTYKTKSGNLMARKEKEGICLDFPMDAPIEIDPPQELIRVTGVADFKNVAYGKSTESLLIHLHDEKDVTSLKPNFELMKSLGNGKEKIEGVIVTSSGKAPFDFVSRYFAPWVGINEDPVTGAAHTVLASYWSKILKKKEMPAYQASRRGGEMIVRVKSGNRVELVGNTIIVFKGTMYLDQSKGRVFGVKKI